MSDPTTGPTPGAQPLPEHPNLDWLRKQAKRRHDELQQSNPDAQLADAQFELAREYGFASWRALKAHVDSLTIEGQLFDAARSGDTAKLAGLLDEHPAKLNARLAPYEWTLLHTAAHQGHLEAVSLLLARGLDVNVRERGDNTTAMHWAAAAGHVDVVRRLIVAGADVIGHGDDHELEIIGWASSWDGCDDDAHRAVVALLLAHGARHHIFSAVAMNLPDEVRRIVAANPAALNQRMSRNENNQLPLHFAVRMNRPQMISLLLELGADPLAVDGGGQMAATYAQEPTVDRAVMEAIHGLTMAELTSAARGKRASRGGPMDLLASLSLQDWTTAERLTSDNPELIRSGGALHLAAKRNDIVAVKWLLQHGADPNAMWAHWDADVTPMHLAVMEDHDEVLQLLLDAGGDPGIHDSRHDSDVLGWAQFFGRVEMVRRLKADA